MASLELEHDFMPSSPPEILTATANGHSGGLMHGGLAENQPSLFDQSSQTDDDLGAANTALMLQVQATQGGSSNTGTTVNVDADASLNASPAARDSIVSVAAPAQTATSFPLARWIELALNSVGETNGKRPAHSPAYLAAALKIAECLSVQVATSDLEPSGDWAENVRVYLKEGGGAIESAQVASHLPDDDIDEQLLLGLFGGDDDSSLDGAQSQVQPSGTVAAHPTNTMVDNTVDIKPSADALVSTSNINDNNSTTSPDSLFNSESASHLEVNYLEIDSAQIICPHKHHNSPCSSNQHISKKMFYLALVFYRLFSGGETPPSTLMTLASLPKAFVSLSTMTLVKNGTGDNCSSLHNQNHDDDSLSNNDNSKRHQGLTQKEIGLCQLSCEYLRLTGVPSPLCHLLLNMFDCVHGDFAGNDCYSNLDDIVSDLQLMIGKPTKFLWGFQSMIMDQSSSSSNAQMQLLSGMEISRDKEFGLIGSCYKSCLSGSSQVVIIQGKSGSGKSWIAHRVGTFIIAEGGIFLCGKFDQVNQATPFSALTTVFGQYCNLILSSEDSSWVEMIVNKLKVALGQDACYLISIIPKLGLILGYDTYNTASILTDINCSNNRQRLNHLFCLLLEVMTANSKSITLWMDHMQWADEASITVLTRLATNGCKKFFLLGCCRENEMENDHPFWESLKSVQTAGVEVTTIQLRGVGQGELNQVMSDLLCLSPRLVRPLSYIVHSKTGGNALFISQLMLSLCRDRLLRLDYDKQRWIWDEDSILSMKLPDNVALCFTNDIIKLPLDVQAALQTLSMFGASLKIEYIKQLEFQIGLKLLDPLKRAVSEGLVIKQKGSYAFSHDSIQEASYNMIGDPLRRENHLIYGKCLVKESGDNNDEMLFVAVNQINHAGPSSVSISKDYVAMARYNLDAGKKSMAMSAFYAACSFFQHGIAFLSGTKYWKDHYTLSVELFELTAQSALASGNTKCVQIHIDELLTNARCFDDALNAHYIHMTYLANLSRLDEAIKKGISIISELGEDIPCSPSNEEINIHIQRTQSMIKGMSEHDLTNKPMITDSKKLMVMKFLAEIQGVAHFVSPAVHKIAIMKMVQMTLSYGLSPVAPFGMACFGSFLAKNGNLTAGHRFVLLAKSLLDELGELSDELTGKVMCVVAESCSYMEPLLAANEQRIQAEIAAISGGDTYWASTCRMQTVSNSLWGGTHLSSLKRAILDAQAFVKQCDNMTLVPFSSIMQRSIDILEGIERELPVIDQLSGSVEYRTNPLIKERL